MTVAKQDESLAFGQKTPAPLGTQQDKLFSTAAVGFWGTVWRRFRRHRLALFGVTMLLILIFLAIAAPVLSPYPYDELHMEDLVDGRPAPPFGEHILGTDQYGRDYLTRLLYGGRISLSVGLISVTISTLIALPLACFAGYFGGWRDQLVMRLVEFFTCIPALYLILTINSLVTKPSIFYVMVIIGAFAWMGTCRQVRAQFLSLREREFVQAARGLGLNESRIIYRHILPNALLPVIINSTLLVAAAIMTESALSYLGMGVQEPIPSWGAMLRQGNSFMRTSPHLAFLPGLMILVTCLSLNFVGDGLRDALDPRTEIK